MKLGRCENCETLREMLEASERRHADLLEKYHALRVSGANSQAVGLSPVQRSLKPADLAIEDMVERYPQFGSGLRKRLQRIVHIERQKPDADEEQIAALVREGQAEVDD
jgi:hypothetical protein